MGPSAVVPPPCSGGRPRPPRWPAGSCWSFRGVDRCCRFYRASLSDSDISAVCQCCPVRSRELLVWLGLGVPCAGIRGASRYPSSKTCSTCKAVKAKLPLHVRVFTCDACGLVIDRDENAARNLADLASAGITGTGVAGGPDAQASKPRGADQKTRATRTRRTMDAGRAGGAVPQQRKETRDRHQDIQALTLR
ncbi:zinc ribbon domain-containing protein [Kitasatospora sp. NPDC018058]|uniref:zinc ribbon domain-containing protein n=1 Tax=Kitasatospora sp. NPDC018058 TaxID=3364025 RepID=UPI0037C0D887